MKLTLTGKKNVMKCKFMSNSSVLMKAFSQHYYIILEFYCPALHVCRQPVVGIITKFRNLEIIFVSDVIDKYAKNIRTLWHPTDNLCPI